MSYLRRIGWSCVVAATLAGCDAPDAVPEDEAPLSFDGKADGIFGLAEGTPQAAAILTLVGSASFEVLDDDVGLDRRAATNILDARAQEPITSLTDLDAVRFVGRSAFEKLLEYVTEQGLVGDSGTELRISTFNIRWFGLDGDLYGSFGSETRTQRVREFIAEHLSDRDILVFQEIVDKELFFTEVVPEYKCVSYDGRAGKHQHIAVCHTDAFEIRAPTDDDNYALEDIDTSGYLRPAVHGTIYTADGDPVSHLLAVHLKANEQSTDRRIEQAEILQARAAVLGEADDLPVIMIGDFNTHFAADTGREENDEDVVEDILHPLSRVRLPVDYTYQEKSGKTRRLDHAFVSPNISVESVTSPGACDLDRTMFLPEIETYYDTLSDHCPVILDLVLR